MSYFYLLIPSIFIDEFLLPFSNAYAVINLKSSSLESIFIYSQWYTFVFFIFYLFSKNESFLVNSSFRPKSQTYKFSKILLIILFSVYALIIALNLPNLLPLLLNKDRISLLNLYAEMAQNYRLNTLAYISMAVVYIITWKTRKIYSYSLLLLPISLEFLALGRTIAFQILLFSSINYILISKKPRYSFLLIPFLGLIGTVLFRFNDFKFSFFGVINLFFSDAFLTYFGGVLTYQEFYQEGNIYSFLITSTLRILPSFFSDYILNNSNVVDIYFETKKYYIDTVGFGLANNIISESAFYGGTLFLIASPVIISFILYLLNAFKLYKTFPGFLYMLFIISSFRTMFAQSGFFINFLSFTYLMFSYLIWITYFERKSVFLAIRSETNVTKGS